MTRVSSRKSVLLTTVSAMTSLIAGGLSSTARAETQSAPTTLPAERVGNDAAVQSTTQIAPKAETLTPSSDNGGSTTTDIIVTAQKREQSLLKVPASVTAISGASLQSKGVDNVQDLVKLTPGLSFVETGRSVPVFSLRGVGFFDTSLGARPSVTVYTDEAPLPFSIEAAGATMDLERVEVLKGPQGTLFGQNATGGAINYVAAKPTRDFAAGVTASYGRFNAAQLEGYISGPITATLNGRIAVKTTQGGDYQQSYTRDASLGSKRLTQLRGSLAWAPIDRLKIGLTVSGFHDGSDTQAGQLTGVRYAVPARASLVPLITTYPLSPADDRAADFDPGKDYRTDSDFYQGVLRIDYDVSDALQLTSLTAYSHERLRQLNDADGTALTNVDFITSGALSTFFQELRGAGEVGRLRYVLGVNYQRDRTREDDFNQLSYATQAYAVAPPPAPPLDLLGIYNRQKFTTKAVFGNLDYELGRLTLHGGARYTQADLSYAACSQAGDANTAAAFTSLVNRIHTSLGTAPIAPLQVGQCLSLDANFNPALQTGALNQHNVSFRTGIDYNLNAHTLFYFNVSRGYKAGSTQAAGVSANIQLVPVTQEALVAYEGGVKARLFGNKLELTGAAFYYDYTNKQVSSRIIANPNVFGALLVLLNIPKSEIKGAEIQATLRPIDGLTLTAAYTYLATKVKGSFFGYDILGVGQDFGGNQLPYTPRNQVVLDGEYRGAISERYIGFLGANANYRSQTTAGFGSSSDLAINSYALIDVRAGVESRNGKYRVQLYGRNITNKYYWTNVARSGDSLHRYAGYPATYGIQLSYRY